MDQTGALLCNSEQDIRPRSFGEQSLGSVQPEQSNTNRTVWLLGFTINPFQEFNGYYEKLQSIFTHTVTLQCENQTTSEEALIMKMYSTFIDI